MYVFRPHLLGKKSFLPGPSVRTGVLVIPSGISKLLKS